MVRIFTLKNHKIGKLKKPYIFLQDHVYVIDTTVDYNGKPLEDNKRPILYIWFGSKALNSAIDKEMWFIGQLRDWLASHLKMRITAPIDMIVQIEDMESPEFLDFLNFTVKKPHEKKIEVSKVIKRIENMVATEESSKEKKKGFLRKLFDKK